MFAGRGVGGGGEGALGVGRGLWGWGGGFGGFWGVPHSALVHACLGTGVGVGQKPGAALVREGLGADLGVWREEEGGRGGTGKP
jgi:hypothetical protein